MRKIYQSKIKNNIYKVCRNKIGKTQDEVAAILNINRSTISKWETGSAFPDIALVPEIAKLYKVPIEYLLNNNSAQIANKISTQENEVKINSLNILPELYSELTVLNKQEQKFIYDVIVAMKNNVANTKTKVNPTIKAINDELAKANENNLNAILLHVSNIIRKQEISGNSTNYRRKKVN